MVRHCPTFVISALLSPFSFAFAPQIPKNHQNTFLFDTKTRLLDEITTLRELQQQDGDVVVDFGTKGGELDRKTRAPQKVDFYSISERVGKAADAILTTCDELALQNPTANATMYLGDPQEGHKCKLDGEWKLLFSTAADATFSKDSKRGDATVKQVVDARKGKITNSISFLGSGKNDTTNPPLVEELNVVIRAKAESNARVSLVFRYAKVIFSRFLFWRVRWPLYIPVPATFITRLLVLFYRIFRKGSTKAPPKAYFDVQYLDDELRIHKTGEANVFVQARPTWKAAQGLMR